MFGVIESLNLSDILNILGTAVVIGGIFFEITPIRISPLSSLFRFIGSKLNEDLRTELNKVENALNVLDNKVSSSEVDRIRAEILDFANSCRNKRLHTRDEFVHIIKLHDKYMYIIEEKGLVNGQLDAEYDYIIKLYKRCLEESSFLCDNGEKGC